jgi:glutathione S-transferase
MNPEREAAFTEKSMHGYAALEVMDDHLKERNWFEGAALSIVDIALYARLTSRMKAAMTWSPFRQFVAG